MSKFTRAKEVDPARYASDVPILSEQEFTTGNKLVTSFALAASEKLPKKGMSSFIGKLAFINAKLSVAGVNALLTMTDKSGFILYIFPSAHNTPKSTNV